MELKHVMNKSQVDYGRVVLTGDEYKTISHESGKNVTWIVNGKKYIRRAVYQGPELQVGNSSKIMISMPWMKGLPINTELTIKGDNSEYECILPSNIMFNMKAADISEEKGKGKTIHEPRCERAQSAISVRQEEVINVNDTTITVESHVDVQDNSQVHEEKEEEIGHTVVAVRAGESPADVKEVFVKPDESAAVIHAALGEFCKDMQENTSAIDTLANVMDKRLGEMNKNILSLTGSIQKIAANEDIICLVKALAAIRAEAAINTDKRYEHNAKMSSGIK
ncbi:MAG: hypothetical protein AABY32_00830 [Nanoarchaeota archaeon]